MFNPEWLSPLARGRSSRKTDQKGVEAIFSPSRNPRPARVIVGVIALFAGISLNAVSVILTQFSHVWGRSIADSYGSLGFASIGVFISICGAGMIVSGFQLSYLPSSRSTSGNSSSDSPHTTGVGDASSLSSASLASHDLRLVLIIFLQGIILLSLYTGLVEEYQSNSTMQAWVRSSLDNAQYLLNWGALLVTSFLLGILVVYSLVTRELVG